jgi:hypothetical protein
MKNNYSNTVKRKEQVQQGMYDGRFRSRVVVDKKKKESKNKCRSKIKINYV